MKNACLIIDFDSTIVTVESLDELAKIALKGRKNAAEIVSRIEEITQKGMDGRIAIDESLLLRLGLLEADKSHVEKLTKEIKKKISPSFLRNKAFLKKYRNQIYVISAGFKEYILPIVKMIGLREDHVLANSFTFSPDGRITGLDSHNPLSKVQGKVKAVRSLKLCSPVHVIGDGYTDLEVRDEGAADKFFAYTETVERSSVMAQAENVLRSFDEYLFLNNFPTPTSYPKSRIKVLLLENIHPKAVEQFKKEGFIVEALKDALPEDELAKRVKDVSLLGVRSKTQVTAKVLKHAPKLLGIGTFCIGTDQTDLSCASERGIAVFNAPFSNTRSVVEMALGEMIILLRKIYEQSVKLHGGAWQKSAEGSFEIRGKSLGIVGYGNIGSQLSVLAEALGMQVLFYDVVDKLALGNAKRCKTLPDLLKASDIVTIHVDGRKSNTNLISEREFSIMRKGAIFLNLSRGHIVDVEALAAAVKSGRIGGAAVDVYPYEPLSNKEEFMSPLRGLPNTIITPHIGGSTLEAQENIAEYVSKKLIEYVNAGSTFFSVNFPNIQLPELHKAHRLLHIHRNVPGILAKINGILARHKINILGQHLKTTDTIGYVITDVDKQHKAQVLDELKRVPDTIKFRVLY